MALNILKRLFDRSEGREALLPLYHAVVAEARQPVWYAEAHVPDTREGRLEMVSAILALVLIRLEALGDEAKRPAVYLTEVFVDDMDGQLREDGVGDVVVGKRIGKMMSALGGRLAAYRESFVDGDVDAALEAALLRNLYRGQTPTAAALALASGRMRWLHGHLATRNLAALLNGELAA
jgi:cytochrome b pre-mRNA-processing protein 3